VSVPNSQDTTRNVTGSFPSLTTTTTATTTTTTTQVSRLDKGNSHYRINTSTMDEVLAEMNNEGASQLENGFYEEAIVTFQSALKNVVTQNEESIPTGCSRSLLYELTTSLHEFLDQDAMTAIVANTSSLSTNSSDNDLIEQDSAHTVDATAAVATKPRKKKSTKLRNDKLRRRHKSIDPRNNGSPKGNDTPSRSSSHQSRRERREKKMFRRVRSIMGLWGHTRKDDGTTIITEDIWKPPLKHIYSKPLRIRDRYNLPGPVELIIHLVHNLALAYHLCAILIDEEEQEQGNSTSRVDWERIIKLYKLVSDMIEREQMTLEESEDTLLMMEPTSPLWSPTFMVSIPNNLACAYHTSGDNVQADVTWQQALVHLWCLLDVGCSSHVECLNEVLGNAEHLLDHGETMNRAVAA